ncbi:MAG: aspartate carbamoyltransferase [Actinomycetota bacterium]|nr:aspartate carbamoyltransferase [Actinomycetota bacterium]
MVRAVVVVTLAVALVACGDDPSRQEEVAARGASVMPFDLDATTHGFDHTDTGGVQTVVADDPNDAAQVTLVREHLREEADRFARGDFDDPAAIHGDQMPGLARLRAGYAEIEVGYIEVALGARIVYTTDDADLVNALHDWFDAQVMDHGEHAESGHGS